MDLLRFLRSLPALFLRGLSKIFKLLSFVLKSVFGEIKWSLPAWTKYIKKAFSLLLPSARAHLKAILIAVAAILVIGIGSYAGYVWKQNQPQAVDVAPIEYNTYGATLGVPDTTNYYQDKLYYNPIFIYFNGNVAPIENLKKEVTEGIALSPNVKGNWTWYHEGALIFRPENDWPIGQTFTIKLDPKVLLAKQALLSADEYKFTTKEFSLNVANAELYQNPEKPSEKNVIFEVRFSHPVDVASFEKLIALNLVAPSKYKISPKPYKYVVKYDEKKLTAWVRSEFVTLPEVDSDMVLTIGKGVKSTLGGASVERSYSQLVTSVYRDVVSDIFLTLAENENNEQQQVLVVNLVDDVNINDLSKQVKAWVLPKDKPKKDNNPIVKNYSWSTYDDITSDILALSTPLNLVKDASESDTQKIVSFKYKTDPKNYIYVTIGKNIETIGGYKAKEGKRTVLNVPEFPKTLSFASSGSLLSLKGEHKVSILSRNIPGVKLDIKRVIPSQLHHLLTFGQNYRFQDKTFDNNNNYYGEKYSEYFTESFSYTQKIAGAAEPGKVTYTGIDLSDYLSGGTKQGVFVVTLYSWDPNTNATELMSSGEYDEYGYYNALSSRLIVVTDIGIIAKSAVDGSSDVFVQSIKEGRPVEGVKISVLGKNGIAVASAFTDANGHTRFKGLREFKNEKTPTTYIAQKDGDLAFLPAPQEYSGRYGDRGLDFSRFDVGGAQNVVEQGKLGAYLFSDRGLYRPGDDVNIGTIVRAENWDIGVGGIPVVAAIYDPRGQPFKSVPFTLDESGFNELTFTTTEASPTGSWSIYLNIASDYKDKSKAGIFLGSTTVAVREFEPDKMKIELKLTPSNAKGWVKPNELEARVKVENLFGTPAQNRRVASKLILNPTEFRFSEYQGYNFYDGFTATSRDRFEIDLEDTSTDEGGNANLSLLLHEHDRASYHLSIIADAYEAGSGRGVTATAQTSISPNDYLVGAKADGDVGYIKKNVARVLNFIAVNQNLSKIDLGNLTIEIVEQKYISVLTLQNSGVYKYQSKLQEIQLSSKVFNIGKAGTNYQLDSSRPGTYKLIVKNALGDVLYKSYYGIVGDANIDRSLERNAELELKLSKSEYKNGEEIEIAINTPYIGSGLITVEKDKVYSWKWFKTSTTSSIQRITVPEDIKGNGYINIQFVRDPNSNDIFMSPLSYGVLPFKVTQIKESANIEISSTALVKPGQDIEISVKTDNRQKVVVFAVDEGILQVANYRLTNPLSHFFQKRYLGVNSYQILDLILPEFSKIEALNRAPGGDGFDEASKAVANKHLNPFKRKTDKPVVFWSGIVEVDGHKSFTYKVPDYFNGKLRVMAVAVSAKQTGIAQTSSTVRDDFVLTPNVPFMAAPNDEFEVTLGVSNNLENVTKSVPINISLVTTKHLEVVGNTTAVITLAQMSEGVLKFRLKATKYLGSGELIFRARYEDKEKTYATQRIGTISVRPVTPLRAHSIMGRMGGEKESVKELRDMYDEYASRKATAAYTPLVISNGLISYLANYPHYCSEQLVSGAIAALIQEKYGANNGKNPYGGVEAILKSRQNSNGAIGLWRADAYGDRFVSVYAAHYLIEAKENGVSISSDLLKNLNNYLTNLANDNSIENIEGLRLRAYAVYLLTRQGVVTTNSLSAVQKALQLHYEKEWQNDVAALYLAATYKLLKMDKEADSLLAKPWKDLSKAYNAAWWSRDYYDPLVINSTAIYLISKHFPQKAKDIPPQALENIVLMIRSDRYTTTSSAMSVLAIDSYSSQLEAFGANANQTLKVEALSKAGAARVIANGVIAVGNFTKNDTQIAFTNPAKIPAWYSVVEEGYDEAAPKESIKKGLEVYKEFTDENGKEVKSVKLGDKVNVTIKVRSTSAEGIGNVAIVDLLPGGFEVVQQPVNSQEYSEEEYDEEYEGEEYYDEGYISPIAFEGTTWAIDYADVREDRVIIYGTAGKESRDFTYQIKSTNVGTYQLPPLFSEAMYDREVQGVSASKGNITVLPAE